MDSVGGGIMDVWILTWLKSGNIESVWRTRLEAEEKRDEINAKARRVVTHIERWRVK